MNAKACKLLRKIARTVGAKNNYLERAIVIAPANKKGDKLRKNSPHSVRGFYRELKKAHQCGKPVMN